MNKCLDSARCNRICRLRLPHSYEHFSGRHLRLPCVIQVRFIMSAANLVIRSKQVVLPGSIAPASIHIADGVITSIKSYETVPADCELIETHDESIVMAGLGGTNLQINKAGRPQRGRSVTPK